VTFVTRDITVTPCVPARTVQLSFCLPPSWRTGDKVKRAFSTHSKQDFRVNNNSSLIFNSNHRSSNSLAFSNSPTFSSSSSSLSRLSQLASSIVRLPALAMDQHFSLSLLDFQEEDSSNLYKPKQLDFLVLEEVSRAAHLHQCLPFHPNSLNRIGQAALVAV
jgi:hypothetical protein